MAATAVLTKMDTVRDLYLRQCPTIQSTIFYMSGKRKADDSVQDEDSHGRVVLSVHLTPEMNSFNLFQIYPFHFQPFLFYDY